MRFVDSDGQVTTQPARVTNRYLWGTTVDLLLLADEQYALGTGAAAISTIANTVQGCGRLVREADYNAAGLAITSTDPAAVDTLFGYTGRMLDQHTGLQYNRARWYDTNTGRWLSQDPIGFAAGDANLYRYVGNHPVLSAPFATENKHPRRVLGTVKQSRYQSLEDAAEQ